MSPFQIHMLFVVGWLVAFLLIVLFIAALRINRHWRRGYRDLQKKYWLLDSRASDYDWDRRDLEQSRAEVVRLEAKCRAVCAQIRRMKGRNSVTPRGDPMHSF